MVVEGVMVCVEVDGEDIDIETELLSTTEVQ